MWTKNLGGALPPHLDKIQKNSYFFRGTVPVSVCLLRKGGCPLSVNEISVC